MELSAPPDTLDQPLPEGCPYSSAKKNKLPMLTNKSFGSRHVVSPLLLWYYYKRVTSMMSLKSATTLYL